MARKIPNAAIVAPITLLIGTIIAFTHIPSQRFSIQMILTLTYSTAKYLSVSNCSLETKMSRSGTAVDGAYSIDTIIDLPLDM